MTFVFQIWSIFLNWIRLIFIVASFTFLYPLSSVITSFSAHGLLPVSLALGVSPQITQNREHSISWSFSTCQKPTLSILHNLTTFPASHWFISWVHLTLPPKSLPKPPHPFHSSLAWIILNTLLTVSSLLSQKTHIQHSFKNNHSKFQFWVGHHPA